MPGFVACAIVAAALTGAAAVVLTRHSQIMLGDFTWAIPTGYAGLILVFGLRGLAPYVGHWFDYARGTPFFDLNRLYYAPLCLVITVALIVDFPPGMSRLVQDRRG